MGSLATSEIEQAKIKMDHIKKELADSVPKVKKAEKQNASLVAELEASKKVITSLKVGLLETNLHCAVSNIT
jgi:structural maintenance of chromosome 2